MADLEEQMSQSETFEVAVEQYWVNGMSLVEARRRAEEEQMKPSQSQLAPLQQA